MKLLRWKFWVEESFSFFSFFPGWISNPRNFWHHLPPIRTCWKNVNRDSHEGKDSFTDVPGTLGWNTVLLCSFIRDVTWLNKIPIVNGVLALIWSFHWEFCIKSSWDNKIPNLQFYSIEDFWMPWRVSPEKEQFNILQIYRAFPGTMILD